MARARGRIPDMQTAFNGFVAANTGAVDVAQVAKDAAVADTAWRMDVPLAGIGIIGDGMNDIPMLSLPGAWRAPRAMHSGR